MVAASIAAMGSISGALMMTSPSLTDAISEPEACSTHPSGSQEQLAHSRIMACRAWAINASAADPYSSCADHMTAEIGRASCRERGESLVSASIIQNIMYE